MRRSSDRLRILVLAAGANPESTTTSLVGYCHAEALARIHDVTLVIRRGDEEAVRRAQGPFRAIEAIALPALDRLLAWSTRRIFGLNYASQLFTAFNYPFHLAFEWRAWRHLRRRIMSGAFDVVLRLLPVTPVLPSPFGSFLTNGPIPFVIGPLNGGLPWPTGFTQANRQRELVSDLRRLYRVLPFGRSTYANASAIICGSSQTCAEFSAYRDKIFFVPENGLDPSIYENRRRHDGGPHSKLKLIFVGRLVPYKACDLALRAAAPLLLADLAQLSVVGDGPDRELLEQLARSLRINGAVTFHGWLTHSETLDHLSAADVLLFPSIREFGGGVVFEALALGAVPVVVDFGGPGDIVTSAVGYKISLTTEQGVVWQLEAALRRLAEDRVLLHGFRAAGMLYARERFTWDAKARLVTDILRWTVQQRPKPLLAPPGRC